jgi:cysteinyl-tRNA synthetase
VRYWFHFEHLKVEGETMSKSKGNYYTFRDVREKGFTAAGVRYFLLSVPFRKQLNFTFDALRGAEKTVGSLRDFRDRVREAKCEPGSSPEIAAAVETAMKDFESGMDDDLNTSVALAALHDLTREINTVLARQSLRAEDQQSVLSALERIDGVLNVIGEAQASMLDDEIQKLIDDRQEARHRRDFRRADEIRDELLNRGIILEDTKDGVRWKRK